MTSTALSTLFFTPTLSIFPDNVSDPTVSNFTDKIDYLGHYQLTLRKVRSIQLDNGQTYSLSYPATVGQSAWQVLIVGCEGTAQIQTVGKDTDNATTINGYLPMYGTAVWPGYAILSTYNLTSITIASQADGTSIQLFSAIAVEDGT